MDFYSFKGGGKVSRLADIYCKCVDVGVGRWLSDDRGREQRKRRNGFYIRGTAEAELS